MVNYLKIITIIAVVGVVGLTIGFIYYAFFEPVEHPPIKVVAEIDRTQYQVGEEILVKPYLINMDEQPITVFGGKPILFFKVYDAKNRQILSLPETRLDILAEYTLKPQMPHYVEEHWREAYTFILNQPGRYKVVAWAEFSFDEGYRYPKHIYADPVWIEVVTRSN